ncbi:c-type cytochrome [Amphritea spongicola]|nr:c-type cytochrome [Aliamphritea spongicola]
MCGGFALPARHLSVLLPLLLSGAVAAAEPDPAQLFQQHCAACHGADRLGLIGPALLPENLKRVRKKAALSSVTNGLPATQMPAFGNVLSEAEIASLADYIYTPLAEVPQWTEQAIKDSHVIYKPDLVTGDATTAKPVYDADPLNVFLVVEAGDHHVSVLDGDTFEPIHRFKSRYALHGGPKYTSDGRFVYFASRDGWVTKYDMYNLEVVAEVRAGINARNVAVSGDDRYVLVGNYLPHTLVVLDATDLSFVKTIPVTDEQGESSRVSAVYAAAPRQSFIAALKDFREVWEISYAPETPLQVARIKMDDYLDDFFFDQEYNHIMGAARNAKNGQVIDLNSQQKAADLDLTGMPHLGSGITWPYGGTTVLATPNLKEHTVTFIDTQNWKTIKKIDTKGPGFFMRSHENSRYAWVDVFVGPDKDVMHVIDKATLEIVKTLKPEPGKTSGHIEFTKDGRYALLSIWEMDGAIIVYDAETLEEVKRLPMKKPVGKYNVHNKITRSAGTSH